MILQSTITDYTRIDKLSVSVQLNTSTKLNPNTTTTRVPSRI
jgi:hypothetical protein